MNIPNHPKSNLDTLTRIVREIADSELTDPKLEARIGDGAFIGSNTALVAPVTVGRGATVGAGSVITTAVPDDALAVARGKQRNIEGWQKPQKKKR